MFFTDKVSGKISFRCNPSPHRPERLFSTTLSPAPEVTEVNESILSAAKKNKVKDLEIDTGVPIQRVCVEKPAHRSIVFNKLIIHIADRKQQTKIVKGQLVAFLCTIYD